jgi:hypothetical protein
LVTTGAGPTAGGGAGGGTGDVVDAALITRGDASALTRATFTVRGTVALRGAVPRRAGRLPEVVARGEISVRSASTAIATGSGLAGRITYAVITLEVAAVRPTAASPTPTYFHALFMTPSLGCCSSA